MNDLLQRLDRLEARSRTLEAQLRAWKWATVLLVGVAVATCLPHGLPANAAQAQQAPFRVVDDGGRVLLEVEKQRDGVPVLRLSQGIGKAALELRVNAVGGQVRCLNAEGIECATLHADAKGAGRFELSKQTGELGVRQLVTQEGGVLGLHNGEPDLGVVALIEHGRGAIKVLDQTDGGASLFATEQGGALALTPAKAGYTVSAQAGVAAAMRISDEKELNAFLAAAMPGKRLLMMADDANTHTTGLVMEPDHGSELYMSDRSGKNAVRLGHFNASDGGRLQLYGKSSELAFEAGGTPGGHGFSAVYTNGKKGATLGINDHLAGVLSLYHPSGARLASLAADKTSGRLALFNQKKAVVFEKP